MKRHRHPRRSSDVRAALDAVRRIVQALRAARQASERHIGLSVAQLFALQQIADHPGASVNDLAALTYTHQSSVSVVVQRLVDCRLVAKLPASQDRRRLCLGLTPRGRRLLRRAPASVQERLVAAIGALSAADRRRLVRSLATIASSVAPTDTAPHPPMLFEESVSYGRAKPAGRRRR